MTKNKKELTEEQLAILNNSYPVSEDSNALTLPRFGMLSKDITETTGSGKLKKIEVVEAAGTFFTERDNGETNDEGKKVWTKTFLKGKTQNVIILYHRRQLRMYDSSLEKFYSTPVYDTADQVLPLYLDKQVVKRGTQAELQAMFPAVTLKGKPSSKLKEDTILFVLFEGEMYQCNLSQSSKWEFKNYGKNRNPSTVITTLDSVEDTFGDNTFSKMTFTEDRKIDGDEFDSVMENQTIIKDKAEGDKKFLLSTAALPSKAEKDMEALESESEKGEW